MKIFVLSMAVVLVTGCATQLSGQGRYIRTINPEQADRCTFLGVVTGSNSGGWDIQHDRQGAMNELKNQAAMYGANAVVINDKSSSLIRTALNGDAYRCDKY